MTPRRSVVVAITLIALAGRSAAGEQPVAIFHAFDQHYADVARYVCVLAEQGYSHVQIAPAQKSNPASAWWGRYQPIDYDVIEGRGSEEDLRKLVDTAHGCRLKVIADVVFNHMANLPEYASLRFPGIGPEAFHARCPAEIGYSDGRRDDETECWLGGNPDLDQKHPAVFEAHKAHLQKLIRARVDGFRFDAAKHMRPEDVRRYIDFLNAATQGTSWNYLEVIEDDDTRAEHYVDVAAVTDFLLYHSVRDAFSFGGDLRTLRAPRAVPDPRSVTFGRNHDNLREDNSNAISPYADPTDSYLATAYVLARQAGTPLVLNRDNYDAPFIHHGVEFRRIMRQRGDPPDKVLAVVDSPNVLVLQRGAEGFFVVNKAAERFDAWTLDLTLTELEGCYRELRNGFTVAIQKRDGNRKFVTRWGTWQRGGLEVHARDALFFVRDPWKACERP